MARLLFVCTGNLCRSPFADGWFNRALDDRFQVASAGVRANGSTSPSRMRESAAEHGIDLTRHVGRKLTPELAAAADLIIVMDRSHIVEVLKINSDVGPKLVLLTEFEARTRGLDAPYDQHELKVWLESLTVDRTHGELLSPEYGDVIDPMGKSRRRHRQACDHIGELGMKLAPRLLAGLAHAPTPRSGAEVGSPRPTLR